MAYQIITEKCSGCFDCYQVCINGAIIDLLEFCQINPAWCVECGSCAEMCFENAIVYNGIIEVKSSNSAEFDNLKLFTELEALY
jgi:flavoprotein